MKKNVQLLGVALFATLTFASCVKELDGPVVKNEGIPFEFYASTSESKTIMGETFQTEWAADDAVNLFHAVAGTTTYNNDRSFSVSAEDLAAKKFKGTLASALESGKSYDWYAIYPYDSRLQSPVNTSDYFYTIGSRSDKSQTQNGVSDSTHICGAAYPLYVKAKNQAASEPLSLTFAPLTSIIKVIVNNTTGKALDVTSIKFTSTEKIVGSFYVDISGDSPKFTEHTKEDFTSASASLTVTGATIPVNGSANFYLAVKPHTVTSGSKIKVSVNGYEKALTPTSNVVFTAGKIKKINFNCDKVLTEVSDVLTTSKLGVTKTSYTSFSGVIGASNAVYAGNVAQNSNNQKPIQFRSSNSSGIVTTTSGGKVKKVIVTWNSITTNDRTIDVYGKSTAYESAADLYNSDTQGTKIGSIVKGTSTELEVAGDYEYIGLRSNNGALYADSITIEWYQAPVSTEPTINITGTTEISAAARGDMYTATYELLNAEGVVSASCDSSWVNTFDCATAGEVSFTVDDNNTTAERSATVTLSYTGAESKTFTVKQAAPEFKVSRNEIILKPENSASAQFTVTSDFDWTADAYLEDGTTAATGYMIDPDTFEWNNNNTQVVDVVAMQANADPAGTVILGKIIITNYVTSATLEIIVKQESSYVEPTEECTLTYDAHAGWTIDATDKTSYFLLEGATNSIVSPTLAAAEIKMITVKARTFGGTTGNANEILVKYGDTQLGTIIPSDNKLGIYTLTACVNVAITGNNKISFEAPNSKSSNGPGISEIVIYYTHNGSKIPLDTPVVTCTAQTKNSLTFSWEPVFNASGYQVSTDGGTVWSTIQTATTYTWSGLTAATSYTLKVKALSNNPGYTSESEIGSANGTTIAEGTKPEYTATIKFGSATGSFNFNAQSSTFTDELGKDWTGTVAGTTSFTSNSAYSQIGASKSPASEITLEMNLPTGSTLKNLSGKFGGFNDTKGDIEFTLDGNSLAKGKLSTTTDVTVTYDDATGSTGTAVKVSITGIAKGVKIYSLTYTYE